MFKHLSCVTNQTTMTRLLYAIVILFILIIPCKLYGQNAFYDAKKISDLIKSKEFEAVIPILLQYQQGVSNFPWKKLAAKYPDHIGSLEEQKDLLNSVHLEELINNKDSMMKTLNTTFNSSDALVRQLKTTLNEFYDLKVSVQTIEFQENLYIEKIGEYNFDSIVNIISSNNEKTIKSLNIDSIIVRTQVDTVKYLFKTHEKLLDDVAIKKQQIDSLLKLEFIYTKLFTQKGYDALTAKEKSFYEKANEQQLTSENSLLNASASSAINYRIPTQSEMIDAMAIYLAKRVKQEVAISFIEKLSYYIRDQTILSNLFPATLKLLNNRDAYLLPNFGTSWQIAISEDFAHIPQNINKCLPSQYKKMGLYFNDGVRIGQLVQQHYSFLEAVNLLHDDPLEVSALSNANTIVYIMNHEFFNTNSKSKYWVTAEQLQQLNKDQLEWLYILIDIRYGESINKMMNQKWLGKSVWREDYFSKKIYPFRNWLTRVLAQLNHFESDIQNLPSQGSGVKTADILTGYWKFQNGLMDVVIDTNFMYVPKEMYAGLGYTKSIFNLYSGIESRNYSMIVEQLSKLFSMLEIDKSVNIQNIFYNRHFENALSRIDEEARTEIAMKFDTLNQVYQKMISSTSIRELTESYSILNRKLKSIDRTNVLRLGDKSENSSQQLIKLVGTSQPTTIDSILFTNDFIQELTNNSGRYTEIIEVVKSMQNNFNQLIGLNRSNLHGAKTFKELNQLLAANKLNNDKYFKIKNAKMYNFANNKLFSLDAGQYHSFLYLIESKNQFKKIRTTMSFLSDVMLSDNKSLALSKVIESYSLPPSSYKLKRNSRFCINIDALVGAYAGVEYITDANKQPVFNPVAGLSAPIGLSLSWGKRSHLKAKQHQILLDGEYGFVNKKGGFKKLEGYNLTLMMSVIDIGAVVSYRITNGPNGGLPTDAKWSQVFSPGIIGLIGIKGMPLCVGTGLRFTPNLRTLNTGLTTNALRFDVGLYFDLPLVNVFYR